MSGRPQIIEVIRVAEQGLSNPLVCRADDGDLYYVKPMRSDQVREWLAWHMAKAFGLPVAGCAQLEMDALLWEELPREFRHIGTGTLFGSREATGCRQFELSDMARVPASLCQRILLFDVWIANEDRVSHNPNLLWNDGAGQLVVIDHNNAFKFANPHGQLIRDHVFSSHWHTLCTDLATRAQLLADIEQALIALTDACHNLPPEWRWENPEGDIPLTVDIDAIPDMLSSYNTHDFWRET